MKLRIVQKSGERASLFDADTGECVDGLNVTHLTVSWDGTSPRAILECATDVDVMADGVVEFAIIHGEKYRVVKDDSS